MQVLDRVPASAPAGNLAAEDRVAVELAVAQWLGCAPVVQRAVGSARPNLQRILRFAVALIITRGRPQPLDLRRVAAVPRDALFEIARVSTHTFAQCSLAFTTAALGGDTDRILCDIGDL
jgi:hypothetical protein